VFPVIASTGPTNMGSIFVLLCQTVDPSVTPIADKGIDLPDFSADGTRSVTQIFADLLAIDLGTAFVNGNGIPIYEQHDTPLARAATATIVVADHVSEESAGIDLDTIGTRVTVEKLNPVTGAVLATHTKIDAAAEQHFGRADMPTISSANVPNATALADELVLEGTQGKHPIEISLANIDNTTLLLILQSQLQTVFTLDDTFGGTVGDGIIQQVTHTIGGGAMHQADYLLSARPQRAFTVDGSALDGPDGLRYP
jgi:hypothetical protein